MMKQQSGKTYDILYFTKPLCSLSISETIDFAVGLGVQGLDLAVRPNCPVTPENAGKTLPQAVKMAKEKSIKIGILTLPLDFTSPQNKQLINIIRVCGQAGVPFIKIGYWNYQGHDYWQQVDTIRAELEILSTYANEAGVCLLLHTHSSTIAHSAALVYNLVNGFNPDNIGVYLDTCHLTLRGENFDQAFDIVGEHLKAIAVKDALRKKIPDKIGMEPFHVNIAMKPLGKGYLNMPRFIDALNNRSFSGYLSYHLEYEDDNKKIEYYSKNDLNFLRSYNLLK